MRHSVRVPTKGIVYSSKQEDKPEKHRNIPEPCCVECHAQPRAQEVCATSAPQKVPFIYGHRTLGAKLRAWLQGLIDGTTTTTRCPGLLTALSIRQSALSNAERGFKLNQSTRQDNVALAMGCYAPSSPSIAIWRAKARACSN